MKLVLAHISPGRKGIKSADTERLTQDFLDRAARLCPTSALIFATEAALVEAADRAAGRSAARLILFDPRGALPTSEAFAATLGGLRNGGTQQVFCCVGPADGWSAEALARAHAVVSFGRLTLPHGLARVLVAEQMYRALTILAGHPYHLGH